MTLAEIVKPKSACAGREERTSGGDRDDIRVRDCLAGDLQAFDHLVLAYRPRIYALARLALGNAEDAQDVTQETFVRAYQALPRYRAHGQFRTWLYTIAANLCKNRLKAGRPLVSWESMEGSQGAVDPTPNPEDRALARERAQTVRAAIDQMGERDRLIVILYYQDDASIDEIARITGCRTGAVKVALHRARARLRERLAGL
jgi:RNA polymerase sigma-70 factor, ECF subfamily